MPGLDPEPVALRLCMTTVLPEGPDNFRIWREGAVTGLVGDNLFKFAPVVGRMLAEAVLGESDPQGLVFAR